MIYLVTLQDRDRAVRRIARSVSREVKHIAVTSYERIFRDRRIPMAHMIFSDLDMLTHYEREAVIAAADALRSANAEVKILNDPRFLYERYPLLRMLEREGVNDFSVTRLDGGNRPSGYPVFIRCEDNHLGVDTDLLHNEQEFDSALAMLRSQGKLLKRRIAVEFCAEPDHGGVYRKYGVINIGGTLIPQHLLHGNHWLLKRLSQDKSERQVDENRVFLKENPHAETIGKIFRLANIDYGRADYTLVNGKIQVYEINTNPNFPPLLPRRGDSKGLDFQNRTTMRQRFVEAFCRINNTQVSGRPVNFVLPQPRHYIRPWKPWQRRQLNRFLNVYPSARIIVPRRYW